MVKKAITGLVAILVLVGMSVLFWPKAQEIEPYVTDRPTFISAQKANANRIMSQSDDYHVENGHQNGQVQNARDCLVEQKLARFLERTSHVDEQTVRSEQERVAKALLVAQNQTSELPETDIAKDELGFAWERLQYKNGTVRYIPASEQ